MKIVIPVLGLGARFKAENYSLPKQLLPLAGETAITYSLSNVITQNKDMIFLLRKDVCDEFFLDKKLEDEYKGCKIIVTDKQTRGTLETVLLAEHLIDDDEPLFIHTLDIHSEPAIDCYKDPLNGSPGGAVFTIKANSPQYSYLSYDSNYNAIEAAEKKVISDQAAVGVYYFSSFRIFSRLAKKMISDENTTLGEFFITPVYNYLIQEGFKVKVIEMATFLAFGTPLEYEFTKKRLHPRPNVIGLASDHSGKKLKDQFIDFLEENNIDFIDYSIHHKEHLKSDYTDNIKKLVEAYHDQLIDKCFTFCRSGQGVNIAANKHEGIRSALIYSDFAAEFAVKHNDAHFFAIPTISTSIELLTRYYEIINSSKFEGGRHQLRLQKLFNEN